MRATHVASDHNARSADPGRIGSDPRRLDTRPGRSAAATRTITVLPAAEDQVSVAIAAPFGWGTLRTTKRRAHASRFHQQLMQTLSSSAASYATAEAAGAAPLQALLDVINAATHLLPNRPLPDDGDNAEPGSGTNGADSGILFGNGRVGGSGGVDRNGGNGGAAGLFGNGGARGTGGLAMTGAASNGSNGGVRLAAMAVGGSAGAGGQWFGEDGISGLPT